MTDNIYLSLWERVAEEEFGIEVETDDLRKFTTYMYDARKGHDELKGIRLCLVDDRAWLVKETVEVIDAQPTG